jgi:GNAT superfamily N-acetyltransferase
MGAAITFMIWMDGKGWLDLFYVHTAARRLGIGRRLIDAAAQRLFAIGCTDVQFGTQNGNEAMKGLGEDAGFEPSTVWVDYRKDAPR